MRRPLIATAAALCLAAWLALPLGVVGGDDHHGCTNCTGITACQTCVPACTGTWDEKKSSKPTYSMKCEYACARGRDAWHAPPPECRCHPPCGTVIVKKKAYKTPGSEKVERVPNYEVKMVAAHPCDCSDCRGDEPLCWWNPLTLFRHASWW